MKKENNSQKTDRKKDAREETKLSGYPLYPDNEDIFRKSKEENDIDPEDLSAQKEKKSEDSELTVTEEKNGIISSNDLDVPGSELDDDEEDVGSEDEENNYYSIGGDDHENLDEDKGDEEPDR